MYGYTPFVCENRQDTKLKILVSFPAFIEAGFTDSTKNHSSTLRFPQEKETDTYVTHKAMDLINKILKEKELRLCSKKYMLNDYQHSKRIPGQLVATAANKHSRDYQGHFVYPDDATDIKAHPFFRDIPWDRLHLMKPPFVPKVKSWEDTRYFEEDEPISDVEESSDDSSAKENMEAQTPAICKEDMEKAKDISEVKIKDKKGKKEKRRPRDLLLRDKQVGKKVLELRKKGAFLGYTYRRPKGVALEQEGDRPGRQGALPRGLMPSAS